MDATQSALLTRIKLLEKELADIKKKLGPTPTADRPKLGGMWKGVDFTEEDFEAAKRSLFREIDDV